MVLGGVAVVLLVGLYLLFMKTRYGLRARATIQNPAIARALGVDTARHVHLDLCPGQRAGGLAGGLFAPTATIVPFFGTNYIVEAFVTVIVGGANALVGTPLAAALLGAVNAALGTEFGLYIGRVGLLLTTIIIIRVLPDGISGLSTAGGCGRSRARAGDDARRDGAAGARMSPSRSFSSFMLVYPLTTDEFSILNTAYFMAITLMALSLALIWGKAGIFSFGQTAFFGIGGYLYGIYTLNVLGSGGDLGGDSGRACSRAASSPPCWGTSCSTAASTTSSSV